MSNITLKRKDGICNLCGEESNLSWDHIPPKGAITLTDMWVESQFKASNTPDKKLTSQNGLKYKTICSKCNSVLGDFDRAYVDFMLNAKKYMKQFKCMFMPYLFSINVHTVKIAKSILGHVLASKTGLCNSDNDECIREYVMGNETSLPNNIRIFYWLYDYNCTIVKTEIAELDIKTSKTNQFSVIKTFPVAFAVCCDVGEIKNTFELKVLANDTINTQRDVMLDVRMQNLWYYPEGVAADKFQLVTKDNRGIIATTKYKTTAKNKHNPKCCK